MILTLITSVLSGIAGYLMTAPPSAPLLVQLYLSLSWTINCAVSYFSPLWGTSYTIVVQTIETLRLKLEGYKELLEERFDNQKEIVAEDDHARGKNFKLTSYRITKYFSAKFIFAKIKLCLLFP